MIYEQAPIDLIPLKGFMLAKMNNGNTYTGKLWSYTEDYIIIVNDVTLTYQELAKRHIVSLEAQVGSVPLFAQLEALAKL